MFTNEPLPTVPTRGIFKIMAGVGYRFATAAVGGRDRNFVAVNRGQRLCGTK
jgi:hypothetical protein